MKRWIMIALLMASACYGGTTNYFAQRASLTAAQRGTNSNFSLADQIPLDLTFGLVAWLPFPAPYVGTQYCFSVACSNDFLITGSAWSTNGGMYFDGSDDVLIGPSDRLVYTNPPLSICFWLRRNRSTRLEGVFAKARFGASAWNGFYCELFGAASTNDYVFQVGNGTTQGQAFLGDNTLTNGVWYFLANVWQSSGNIELYINGNLSTSGKVGLPYTGSISNAFPSTIGRNDSSAFYRWFQGRVDDLLIFRGELTAEQIVQLMNSTTKNR